MAIIKGHSRLRDVEDGAVRAVDRIGNGLADAAAKMGAKQHPQDAEAEKRINATVAWHWARTLVAQGRVGGPGAPPARPIRRSATAMRTAARRSEHVIATLRKRYRCWGYLRSSATLRGLLQSACAPAQRPHRSWQCGCPVLCTLGGGRGSSVGGEPGPGRESSGCVTGSVAGGGSTEGGPSAGSAGGVQSKGKEEEARRVSANACETDAQVESVSPASPSCQRRPTMPLVGSGAGQRKQRPEPRLSRPRSLPEA